MSRYNLITEPWISVITDEKGNTKEVSLEELFSNARDYLGLGGDTKTQDFAIMRIILAVCHTVFSRVDIDGEPLDGIELDEKYYPTQWDIDEDEYQDQLLDTWEELWELGQFPDVVIDYLYKWHDRFYLLDDKYPFMQITRPILEKDKANLLKKGSKTGRSYGKELNRLITESSNKVSLFSPKTVETKEILTPVELARWLATYHGYTGTAGKQVFRKLEKDERWSKGWIYDIGGLYLTGDNLYETLLLNMVMRYEDGDYQYNLQRPSWEYSPEELLDYYLNRLNVDNQAELYTNWSRAIYIDPEIDLEKGFECIPIKVPEVDHQDQFLEPMTMWNYNTTQPNKDHFTPRKHQFNRSMWRSFGLITLPTDVSKDHQQKRPGIINWIDTIQPFIGDYDIGISGVSMEADGNATSWTPTNEIYDQMKINDLLLTDLSETGWVYRIYNTVELTKEVIEVIYGSFLKDIEYIRYGKETGNLLNSKKIDLYSEIDEPFRYWSATIKVDDDMGTTVAQWYKTFRAIILTEAKEIVDKGATRDYKGVEETREYKGVKAKGKLINMPIAYNIFISRLNKKIGRRKDDR